MARFICVLVTQILLISQSRAWLNNPGRLKCQSCSGPPLRTVSYSSRHPLFLNFQTFLNSFMNEPPLKPRTDAIYVPEPFEVTEKSSVMFHRQYEVYEDTGEGDEGMYHHTYYNPYESSEEESEEGSPYEFENYKEVTYKEDIDGGEDMSDEDDNTATDEGRSEYTDRNDSYSDADRDDSIVILIIQSR